MTACKMRRRRRRRSAAVDRCLRRYHRQIEIEEELGRLLSRSDSLREVYLPLLPSSSRRPDMRGRWSGSAEVRR